MSERTFLDEITIRSIGVIDQATLEISKGLTVLSGETGAGKTMILTALNLILGGKSDSALVRKGSERLIASGRFTVPMSSTKVFDECGVIVEDGELIITRSVTSDGKSKATSNGVSVTASTLAAVSQLLVEVHAQAANIHISKSTRQRELLDRYAGSDFNAAMTSYSDLLAQYHGLKSRITALKKSIDKLDQELGELREFVSALTKLKLESGEYIQINADIERLSNVEELRIAGAKATSAIEDEESGSLASIGIARRSLEIARSKDVALDAIYTQLSEGFFLIDEARSSLAGYMHSLEADPARLDYLNARKAEITSLIKRYGGSSAIDIEADLLVERFASSAHSIADLEGGDDRLKEMESELVVVKKSLVASAKELTHMRIQAGERLGTEVTAEIQQLSMPHTEFSVHVESADY